MENFNEEIFNTLIFKCFIMYVIQSDTTGKHDLIIIILQLQKFCLHRKVVTKLPKKDNVSFKKGKARR